jgi:hypothetical protein
MVCLPFFCWSIFYALKHFNNKLVSVCILYMIFLLVTQLFEGPISSNNKDIWSYP